MYACLRIIYIINKCVINFSPSVRLQSLVKYSPTVETSPGPNAHLHSWCSADECIDHIDVRVCLVI